MSTHREKIFKRRGEGTLKPKDNDTIIIPVEFTCCQYFDGNIEGTIKLLEEKHRRSDYIDHKEHNLSATLGNGEQFYIKNLLTIVSQSIGVDAKFYAAELRLECREISSNSTKKYCKFGISNMVQHEKLGIDIGDVTPVMAENQWEIWEYIRDRKVSCITGYIQICLDGENKLNSVEEYTSLLYEKIRRILLLTSLAKGTRVDWAYFEQIDEKSYERIYSERRAISNKYTGMRSIISPLKLHDYLETTYPNYTDNFDRNTRFDFAIHWYLESFLTNNIESMYIKLFTALEALVFGFVSFKKCENIFNTGEDFKKFRKQLKEQMEPLLKDRNMDKTKMEAIYPKLLELNRYPIRTNLEIFLTEYHIEFNDLIDDLGSLIKCRNEIIHSGSIERITSTELIDEYKKLLPLIQWIFLSLLKYDGESTI